MGSDADGSDNVLLKEGVAVRVRGDDGDTQDATIIHHHRNGNYSVKYRETGKVEKNVPKVRIEGAVQGGRTRKQQRKDERRETKRRKESEELDIDSAIQLRNEKGDWCDGFIHKVHRNGKYDVVLDGKEKQVLRNIERRELRTREKQKKRDEKEEEEDSDSQDERRSMRKRTRGEKKKNKRELSTSEEESEESVQRARSGRLQRQDARILFSPLRVNQFVEFEDKSGRIRRGRIKSVNNEQRICDIRHESDTEKVSKRISLNVVRPTTSFGRLFAGNNRTYIPFQINTHVYYRTDDGSERKGIILKVSRSSGRILYDVEDLQDGTMVKQLSVGKLRAVPWLDHSFPNWNGLSGFPTFPSFSLFSSNILRRGMNVRFRRIDKGTGRIIWYDGVIIKAKSNACCIIEHYGPNGDKKREEVKNADIQARFFRMPFSGMLDGLSLPTIQLPIGLFKVGSAVEISNGAKVFLGTILSSNELDRTYTIEYEDGRKEKNVQSDRVRLSLRRLRIGTEVEMIVEGPCKEVSKLDGEVAWIHRNEKVAVRINGGNSDVFAEVCTHALMVNGTPAFTAPLSSTWFELMGYYLNLAIEIFIYTWFFFGLMVELDEMLTLHEETSSDMLQNPEYMTAMYVAQKTEWGLCQHPALQNTSTTDTRSYLLIPSDVMATDRAWLLILLIAKGLLTASSFFLVLRCLRSKFLALQDDLIDLKEFQQERVMRRHLSVAMGWTILVTFATLINYASLLNRFDFYCLLNDKALSFDQLALRIQPFTIHTNYPTPIQILVSLAAKTTFNLFRGVTFHVLLFAFPTNGTDFIRRIGFLLPSVAVTALFSALGGAALHTFYYVQKSEIFSNQTLDMSTYTDLSIILLVLSLWFIHCIYTIGAGAGRFVETRHERQRMSRDEISQDVLSLAERGEFGLRAQREALVTKVERRQDELGVCKLSILRLYRYILVHFIAASLAIYIDVTLHAMVKEEKDGSSVALRALKFHFAFAITWLVGSVMATLVSISLRQQSPELRTYILDT